jgi:E3 ubiquitin-protein ligase DOA10
MKKYVKCNCKNDLKYKHQHCINVWINHKKDNVDMYKCELCTNKYIYINKINIFVPLFLILYFLSIISLVKIINLLIHS